MPKLLKNESTTASLPVPWLRALRTLAGGDALTLARMGDGASGATADALAKAGLVTRDELDVDGVVERTLTITAAGKAALNGDASVGAALPQLRAAKPLNIGSLIPIFGSNRKLAQEVGRLLAGCAWVGVPFAGGLSELPWIEARTVVVCDAHGGIINLARCAADPKLGPQLYRRLKRNLFHESGLRLAQEACRSREAAAGDPFADGGDAVDIEWAEAYFVAAWQARNGEAGKAKELASGLSTRWDAGGGDSAKRYFNAAHGLLEWRALLRRCTFVCGDALAFIAKIKDQSGHACYCDAPWPDDGNTYKHKFTLDQQRQLAEALSRFEHATVVVRYGVHPLIEELYAERLGWTWHRLVGKTQSNSNKMEVLITKNLVE